jgi:hypothetical protein
MDEGGDRDPKLVDRDRDGLPDACEQALAERFAPVIYHSSDESNFPTNVDRFLEQTSLNFYDDTCSPDLVVRITDRPSQLALVSARRRAACGGDDEVHADGTRSRRKHRTFFLADLPKQARRGSVDTREWTTYVHAYRDVGGGVTVQYWRFYAYNDAANDHGGDWEGLHLVLDRALRPSHARLFGHSRMRELPAKGLRWEGNHVVVFSEGGGHATRASGDGIFARGCDDIRLCTIDVNNPRTFVRQETWPGGRVRFPNGQVGEAGAIVNVGARTAPLNGQLFIRYAGLWGSPGRLFFTSGYWGPVFNETRHGKDGFLTPWCAGMVAENVAEECYPGSVTQ